MDASWTTVVRILRVSPHQTIGDPELLAAAQEHIDRQRAHFGDNDGIYGTPAWRDRIKEIRDDWAAMTPERYLLELRETLRSQLTESLLDVRKSRLHRWRGFIAARGIRYEDCRLSNFLAVTPAQQAALQAVRGYDRLMRERIEAGEGLLLYGTKGTGKDHLLCGLARRAILYRGIHVRWTSGADLERISREAIKDSDAAECLDSLKKTAVLALSDPCPGGSMTPFQLASLTEVLDYRYSHMLPTWATVNAPSRANLEEMVSSRLVDRLVDGATIVPMLWPSYRKRLA